MEPKHIEAESLDHVKELLNDQLIGAGTICYCRNGDLIYITSDKMPVSMTTSGSDLIALKGTPESPIILSELPDGTYTLSGQFKSYESDTYTVNSPMSLLVVNDSDDSKSIVRFTGKDIVNYMLKDGAASTDHYITRDYIDNLNIITKNSADFMTRNEIMTYVKSNMGTAVWQKI